MPKAETALITRAPVAATPIPPRSCLTIAQRVELNRIVALLSALMDLEGEAEMQDATIAAIIEPAAVEPLQTILGYHTLRPAPLHPRIAQLLEDALIELAAIDAERDPADEDLPDPLQFIDEVRILIQAALVLDARHRGEEA